VIRGIDLGSTFRLSKLVKVYEEKSVPFGEQDSLQNKDCIVTDSGFFGNALCGYRLLHFNGTSDCKKLKTNRTTNRFNLFVKLLNCELESINDLIGELLKCTAFIFQQLSLHLLGSEYKHGKKGIGSKEFLKYELKGEP
jgi:hypothetical protein